MSLDYTTSECLIFKNYDFWLLTKITKQLNKFWLGMKIGLPTISKMGIGILIILNSNVLFEVAFSIWVIMKSINSEKHHRCCT